MFHATRSEKLVEKSHRMEIQVGHGYAELRVRRTVHNGGPRHDQAIFYIDMPDGAVAIGLRTLGVLEGKPHWFAGELLEAEAAAAKYRELTGVGGYYPKDPALLSWRSQSHLALQVFPCAPDQDKTVEYTLRIPTTYHDGRHHLTLPRMGTETLAAEASVTPMVAGESIFIDDKPAQGAGWVKLKQEVDLSVAPNTTGPLDGALASLSVSAQKNFVHYHFEAAPRVATVPAGAHVVVLLDASLSLSEHQVINELAMARSFVNHFPNGHIAIVPFDRRVRPSATGFVSVGQARSTFRTMALDRHNGSHVDEALAHADAMLAKIPAGGAKRILLLTDTKTRNALTPEVLKTKLAKSNALLHVGIVSGRYQSELSREDEHEWNTVTRPSGGLVWEASINADEGFDRENETVFEEWARPKRIHHLAVHARGLEKEQLNVPTTLDEGQGVDELLLPASAAQSVEITGELWATPIKKFLAKDDAENQRWAGLFFGTHLYSSITEEEMMPLAMLGKVVSPVTSYLAIEPGVRPSTEGLEETSGVGMGFGSGFGSAGHRLFGSSSPKYPDDKLAFLQREVERRLAQCGGKGRSAKATLETTAAEIVELKASIEGESATSSLTSCFTESLWEIYLRSDFQADHDLFTISI